MATISIRFSTAPARKKPKAGDRRFLKGRQVWQVRQQVKVGGAYLVSGGSSRPVWEWVDEGSDRDRKHQWRKRLEQPRASTAQLVECDHCPTSGGCVGVCMKARQPTEGSGDE